MKVDIIMPTHNPSSYIVEALDSCLAQSYKNIKITVIDDCSTTDISYLKKRYPQVNFLKTINNMGPAGARNFGISRTNGDLISFLDDDDIMDPNKIVHSVSEFTKNPKTGMVCGNYRILVNRVNLRSPFYKKAPVINFNTLMRQNLVASGSVTVRRSVLEDVGNFDERFWIGEDYELWLRIAQKYSIKYIHKPLYYYSIVPRGGSLTQRDDIQKEHLKNLEIIKREARDRAAKNIKNSEK